MSGQPAGWRAWVHGLSPWMLAAVAFALALRLLMVFVVHPLCPFDADQWATPTGGNLGRSAESAANCFEVRGDSSYTYVQARAVADGKGFLSPHPFQRDGTIVAGAGKPPLNTLTIAALAKIGITSPDGQRTLQALAGTAAVLFVGLLTRRLAGQRAGTWAAWFAALYPMLWINDWRMLNESFLDLATILVFYASYRFWERPTVRWSVLLAVGVVMAGYCRFEMLLYLPLVGVPLALFGARRLRLGNRVKLIVVMALASMVAVSPWVLYNYARFSNSVGISPGPGAAMANGACDEAFYGDKLGYLSFNCFDPLTVLKVEQMSTGADDGTPDDESQLIVVYGEAADKYIAQNHDRLPVVIAARVGRLWDVYRPFQNVELNTDFEERGGLDSTAALLAYYLLLPLGAVGIFVLRRVRVPILPVVGVVVISTMAAALTFGLTRYRSTADVALCFCAGVGIVALLRLRDAPASATDPPRSFANRLAASWSPGSSSVQRAHDRQPPSLLDSVPKNAKWGAMAIGAVVAIVVAGVVIRSAGVERPPGAGPATVPVCESARRAIGDVLTADSAPPGPAKIQNLRNVMSQLTETDVQTKVFTDPILQFLSGLEQSGQSMASYLATLPPAETTKLNQAGAKLNAYVQQSCR